MLANDGKRSALTSASSGKFVETDIKITGLDITSDATTDAKTKSLVIHLSATPNINTPTHTPPQVRGLGSLYDSPAIQLDVGN
jgi:hypothetical protein